jgi:hypothetical protein
MNMMTHLSAARARHEPEISRVASQRIGAFQSLPIRNHHEQAFDHPVLSLGPRLDIILLL